MKQAVAWRTGAVLILAGALATSAGAQGQAPAAVSAEKAKELVTLMAAQKLESFAARDGENTLRFVAVLVVPNVQLLMVSCEYTRRQRHRVRAVPRRSTRTRIRTCDRASSEANVSWSTTR